MLIEVNGIKVVNADFSSLPNEGVIAWKLSGPGSGTVTIKNIKFTDLGHVPADKQPTLRDPEVLRAEVKYSDVVNKANEELVRQFDAVTKKLQASSKDHDLIGVLDAEKELFKSRGLVPWSNPMRKALRKYGTALRDARDAIGKVFDRAIDRAEKAQNEKLKAALNEEAAQVLAPHPVATWQAGQGTSSKRGKRKRPHKIVLYSDGSYLDKDNDDDQPRYWGPGASDDYLVLEFPQQSHPGSVSQQDFQLSRDGKTLTTYSSRNHEEVWQIVVEPEEPDTKGDAQQ